MEKNKQGSCNGVITATTNDKQGNCKSGSKQKEEFIAVRSGKGGLRSCIFLDWEDAASFVEKEEGAEYAAFANIQDALVYTRAGKKTREEETKTAQVTTTKTSKTSTLPSTKKLPPPHEKNRSVLRKRKKPEEEETCTEHEDSDSEENDDDISDDNEQDGGSRSTSKSSDPDLPPGPTSPRKAATKKSAVVVQDPASTPRTNSHSRPKNTSSSSSNNNNNSSSSTGNTKSVPRNSSIVARKKRPLPPPETDDEGYETSTGRRLMKPNSKWTKMYEAVKHYKETHNGAWPRWSAVTKKQRDKLDHGESENEDEDDDNDDDNDEEDDEEEEEEAETDKEKAADHPSERPLVCDGAPAKNDGNKENVAESSKTTKGNHGKPDGDGDDQKISLEDMVKWMENQRYHYRLMKDGKKACMNPIKIQKLEDIGFDFRYRSWEDYLAQLKQVKEEFLKQQEQQQKQQQDDAESGKTSTKESLEQYLDKILVHPFCNHRYEEEELENSNRDPNTINYNDLGKWFYKQQEQCRLFLQGKPCHISKEQMNKLFALQVCDPGKLVQPKQKRPKKSIMIKQEKAGKHRMQKQEEDAKYFELMFVELEKYKEQHGTCHVPKSLNNALSKWCISVKNMYRRLRSSNIEESKKRGQPVLTATRIQRLHDLGFVFATTEKSPYLKFHEWVERLKAFKEEHGHTRVPHDFPADPGLSAWVHRQRNEYRKYQDQLELGEEEIAKRPYASKYEAKSTLTPERIQTLNELGFIWQVAKRTGSFFGADRKTWDERFEELVEYKKIHGHTLVPQGYPKLGEWVKRQRRCYKFLKDGKKQPNITPEQVLRLQEIGFVFDVRKQQRQQKAEEETKHKDDEQQQQKPRQREREQQQQFQQQHQRMLQHQEILQQQQVHQQHVQLHQQPPQLHHQHLVQQPQQLPLPIQQPPQPQPPTLANPNAHLLLQDPHDPQQQGRFWM